LTRNVGTTYQSCVTSHKREDLTLNTCSNVRFGIIYDVTEAEGAVVMVVTLAAAAVEEESSNPEVPQVCSADP